MIGIRFNIKNEYNTFISKILKDAETNNCKWKIVESEVLDYIGNDLFNEDIYSDTDFKNIIENVSYYSIFLNLQLYDINDEINEIQNYNDFINSNCKLILFVTDNIFVDIYAKDPQILDIIYKNAINNQFAEICYIYDINKARKNFSAYSD